MGIQIYDSGTPEGPGGQYRLADVNLFVASENGATIKIS